MDAAALWKRYQEWLYYHEDLGFYLDVSRVNFDDAFVSEMAPRFEKAFQDIKAIEAGAIANPDENRMVGHYWLRDPDLAPNDELRHEITSTLKNIETFSQQIRTGNLYPPGQERFTDILSIGIGGSALGPEFVAQALGSVNPPLNIHFIDNTDPEGIDKTLGYIG
ncbi:MAG: glucose-6-phosphate isomerase, partial [Cyanobacteria bacterium P01_F01_bin.4]